MMESTELFKPPGAEAESMWRILDAGWSGSRSSIRNYLRTAHTVSCCAQSKLKKRASSGRLSSIKRFSGHQLIALCEVSPTVCGTNKLRRRPVSFRFAVAANALAAHPRAWRNLRAHDRLVFRATGRAFPWHAMTRFQGGERGCAGQKFKKDTPGNCDYLPAGAAFGCSTKMCA
jgi:hypothetical protein